MRTWATSQAEYLAGIIIGGGWGHDELDNPCASVRIVVNSHHLTLTDDTVRGWTLEEFDGAPDPETAFHKAFGAVFGDAAEFDENTLRDFRKTLEGVGCDLIVAVYGGRAIPLRVYRLPPEKE